eukprot:3261112-Prymnesium_polylepis.1
MHASGTARAPRLSRIGLIEAWVTSYVLAGSTVRCVSSNRAYCARRVQACATNERVESPRRCIAQPERTLRASAVGRRHGKMFRFWGGARQTPDVLLVLPAAQKCPFVAGPVHWGLVWPGEPP